MVVSQARCANSTFPIVWRAIIETNVVFDKEKCKPFVLNISVEFLHVAMVQQYKTEKQ